MPYPTISHRPRHSNRITHSFQGAGVSDCSRLLRDSYMFPRVFGDEFGDEFGDSLNLVINLVTNSVMNFVNH